LPAINLLHLSSAKAIDAARRMALAFPHVDFRREVTIGHLLADIDTAAGIGGKVNPPIRPRSDVEALWSAVADRTVDWVVSDHACCRAEDKFGDPADDVFLAKSGFGGTEYLLSGLLTEGLRRGLSHGRIAELASWNPAQRYGLRNKGTIAAGYDADLALVDPGASFVVRAEDSFSAQEYTPFEGMELTGQVRHTYLRGRQILRDGNVVAPGPLPVPADPSGRRRPRLTTQTRFGLRLVYRSPNSTSVKRITGSVVSAAVDTPQTW
jgi:allantoinase